MFVAGVVVVGGIIVAHDKYSDDYYSDHSRHSRYDEYGDSQLRNEISNLENRVRSKETEVQKSNNFNSQISALKKEKSYTSLGTVGVDNLIFKIKDEMKRELETEIKDSQRELEEINKMISKINELELQARGVLDENGFDKDGYDMNGRDKDGFDGNGFNRYGYDKDGYDKDGYDKDGYDRNGLDRNGDGD